MIDIAESQRFRTRELIGDFEGLHIPQRDHHGDSVVDEPVEGLNLQPRNFDLSDGSKLYEF